MIRLPDFPNAALWARSTPTAATRADAHDVSAWFDADAAADVRISSDLGSASRGLGVAQHAAQVLAHLCAEPDERV